MARFLLIALNGPTDGEGHEEAYNRWYNQVHKADLEKVDRTVSVRRFKTVWQSRIDKPFISITEVEAENAEAVMRELAEKASDFTGSHLDRTTSISLLGLELDTSAA
jgi:hypothetical protein